MMNAIESGLVQLYGPCAGGCGEVVFGAAMCAECARLAADYDRREAAAREGRKAGSARKARRGMFTFLGWNAAGPARGVRIGAESPRNASVAPLRGSAARLDAESAAAAECGDPARRSALLAKLPRVDAGVTQMCGGIGVKQWRELSRWELCQCDVPLCMVAAILLCDLARWMWWAAVDAAGCFVSRRLRGRLGMAAMLAGIALGAGASWLAWGVAVDARNGPDGCADSVCARVFERASHGFRIDTRRYPACIAQVWRTRSDCCLVRGASFRGRA